MAKFITITPHNFKKSIQRAVSILHQGDIVAFPTDTVYGVGVDAFNPKAIEKIYEVKERPADKPLPVLVASIDDVLKISTDLPSNFEELVAAFWPGALTLVVKANNILPVGVTSERDRKIKSSVSHDIIGSKTVGIRMPDNPIALELIKHFGNPLATTSANRSGEAETVTAEEVRENLDEGISLILDGGPTATRVVSTVVNISIAPPVILRQGQITAAQIAAVIGDVVLDIRQGGKGARGLRKAEGGRRKECNNQLCFCKNTRSLSKGPSRGTRETKD